MRLDKNGFSIVWGLLTLAILMAIGFVGWRVYVTNLNTKKSASTQGAEDAPRPSGHKRIVAVGDIVCDPHSSHVDGSDPNYCQDYKIAQQVKQLNPDAILALGDLQYDDGSLEKFQSAYAKNWGAFNSITYPAPGNHEYATPQAGGYYTYFKSAPIDPRKGYYSFTLGGWHIASLNSNCDKIGGCAQESPQVKWLEEDLSKAPEKCTLAFWHHPHFTSGRYTNDADTKSRSENMWARLSAHKADVILNGHDHIYERFALQTVVGEPSQEGVRQFTVGTGGKELYEQKGAAPNSEKVVGGQYGVLVMDLYESAYKWQFVTAAGQVLDSGYQQCK